MTEETKSIQLTEDQHLTLREYNAQLELAEVHFKRIEQSRFHWLREQGLLDESKTVEGDNNG
ncbi:hypothetical protein FV239_24235 [Escherichia coli]|uniref:hypothetical protein n=1 Tax=Escherichia coli TaxID=562 RepID=UPI000CAED10F|nr:hypothetical protein [Escherichia coli]EFD0312778.1 hypothetical protein [Escherichia coli]EFH3931146.1 hypothetical protein [Escherichia coli]EFH7310613.1 hypothetical protein [Escherichia coli]EFH8495725.1 hypothetical protein [Escherichia coli]EFI4647100.1 hypothetical protein [Escherichia coli]